MKLIQHLKQESTWRGFVALGVALGLQVSPELQSAIISAGLAIIGLINVVKNK